MSYANLIMYNAVIPSYDGGEKDGKKDKRVIDADRNPEEAMRVVFDE
jgi:hypothetical protein